jgi:hypothetical protein
MQTKFEGKLKMMKIYRLRLLHNYCRDVLKEVYHDSLKLQLLDTTKDLRLKAGLIPKDK